MDLHMPNVGGIDATHRIRQIPGYADIPIIAMTANAFNEDQVACIRAGMNAYLSKPAPLNLLYQTLLEWLDRKAQSK
jgi:CheY-like chemotaxis protein